MSIESVVKDMAGLLARERVRLDRFEEAYQARGALPRLPRKVTEEHRRLLELARTPFLGLVVETVVQSLNVVGFKNVDDEVSPAWEYWLANDWDSRQGSLYRDVAMFGYAFGTVRPGVLNGEAMPVLRAVSPRRMWAEFDDVVADPYPIHALQDLMNGRWKYFTAGSVVELRQDSEDGRFRVVDVVEHGAGVCPVVQYANMQNLDGVCVGEVEPYIPTQDRIFKGLYDRGLTQHFNSWKVMYATGMKPPKDQSADERERAKLRLRQDDILVAGEGVQFGQLDETTLSGFLDSLYQDLDMLAAVSQTPSSTLTAKMVNLSADAIVAMRAPLSQKLQMRQRGLADAHGRLLRCSAAMMGDVETARDYRSHVVWDDFESRSLAQTVDALGKAAQMLGVPVEFLWTRIPGVTEVEALAWSKALEKRAVQFGPVDGVVDVVDGVDVPGSYENQEKPWDQGARFKRGKLRRRDGDGDGAIDE